MYDVIIIGGGPAGLSAALCLGRARKRVLLCDAGPRRNAAATHIQGFITRDGTPPDEFRRLARADLAAYSDVHIRDVLVHAIDGERGAFRVRTDDGEHPARRILLAAGMVDEPPPIEGLRERWGSHVFVCPYCHGYEVRDRPFAFLAPNAEAIEFALLLRGWTQDVVALTHGAFGVPAEAHARLAAAGVEIDERAIARVSGGIRIEFADGTALDRGALFVRPQQRLAPVVAKLGLAVDAFGFVKLDDHGATSVPGIYACGDLLTGAQAAIIAAGSGYLTAARLNHDLTTELVLRATPPA